MVDDIESEMIERELQRIDRAYAFVAHELIEFGIRPGAVFRVPAEFAIKDFALRNART